MLTFTSTMVLPLLSFRLSAKTRVARARTKARMEKLRATLARAQIILPLERAKIKMAKTKAKERAINLLNQIRRAVKETVAATLSTRLAILSARDVDATTT